MGFSPREIDAMSLWEFHACIEGWNRGNGGEDKPEPMSGERFEELKREVG